MAMKKLTKDIKTIIDLMHVNLHSSVVLSSFSHLTVRMHTSSTNRMHWHRTQQHTVIHAVDSIIFPIYKSICEASRL